MLKKLNIIILSFLIKESVKMGSYQIRDRNYKKELIEILEFYIYIGKY